VLPRIPRLQTRPPPDAKGLQRRHVPHVVGLVTWQGRALMSPHVLRLQTCLPVRQGSSVAPWLLASKSSPRIFKAPDIRLIMASLGTRSRLRIKYVQDKPYVTYD
jgi:hypothetical protein